MKKWEYYNAGPSAGKTKPSLNELGLLGWELICMSVKWNNPNDIVYILKREIVEEKAKLKDGAFVAE